MSRTNSYSRTSKGLFAQLEEKVGDMVLSECPAFPPPGKMKFREWKRNNQTFNMAVPLMWLQGSIDRPLVMDRDMFMDELTAWEVANGGNLWSDPRVKALGAFAQEWCVGQGVFPNTAMLLHAAANWVAKLRKALLKGPNSYHEYLDSLPAPLRKALVSVVVKFRQAGSTSRAVMAVMHSRPALYTIKGGECVLSRPIVCEAHNEDLSKRMAGKSKILVMPLPMEVVEARVHAGLNKGDWSPKDYGDIPGLDQDQGDKRVDGAVFKLDPYDVWPLPLSSNKPRQAPVKTPKVEAPPMAMAAKPKPARRRKAKGPDLGLIQPEFGF